MTCKLLSLCTLTVHRMQSLDLAMAFRFANYSAYPLPYVPKTIVTTRVFYRPTRNRSHYDPVLRKLNSRSN